MNKLKNILAVILVSIVTASTSIVSYAQSESYFDSYLEELNDENEIINDLRDFAINQLSRFIFKVGDIDRFIFINGNIDLDQIWNIDLSIMLDTEIYGYNKCSNDKQKKDKYKDLLDYNISYLNSSIESFNECMPDINLFIYSLGDNYYKYNYLWKDMNTEIAKINNKIKKYNKQYGYNYSELSTINGLYDSYYKYHNDKELQDQWQQIIDIFSPYYSEEEMYPQHEED